MHKIRGIEFLKLKICQSFSSDSKNNFPKIKMNFDKIQNIREQITQLKKIFKKLPFYWGRGV